MDLLTGPHQHYDDVMKQPIRNKVPIACWALQELVSRSPLRSVGNPPLAHAFALAGGIGESAIRALRQLLEQLLRFSESPGIELRDSGFK